MTKHIVSFSGGKDSTVMLLMMLEKGMRINQVIFADTTLEFPEMYEYIDKIENYIGREIIRIKPKKSFDEWCYGKITRGKRKGELRGLPPVLYPCYWCRESKVNALLPYTKENYVYLGIASDEYKRAKPKPGIIAVYPLVEWGITEIDCLDYLRKRDLVNPLYLHVKRTGCWLCPKQGKQSLKYLFTYYPELWEKLKEYEKVSYEFHPDYKLIYLEKRFREENKQLKIETLYD